MSYTKYIQPTIIVGLLIALIWSVRACQSNKVKSQESLQLVESLGDTVKYYKKKDSTNVAQISVITTESVKAFTNLNIVNEEIKELQRLVKEYQKSLKPGSSVTRATIETKIMDTGKTKISKIDTVKEKEYISLYPTYVYDTSSKWLDFHIEMNKDTSIYNIKMTNQFSAVVGYDKKKRKPFVDLLTENPYTTTKELRTYQVTVPKRKRFGIGPQVGAMFLPEFNPNLRIRASPYVGVGVSYNLIIF